MHVHVYERIFFVIHLLSSDMVSVFFYQNGTLYMNVYQYIMFLWKGGNIQLVVFFSTIVSIFTNYMQPLNFYLIFFFLMFSYFSLCLHYSSFLFFLFLFIFFFLYTCGTMKCSLSNIWNENFTAILFVYCGLDKCIVFYFPA